MNTRTLIPARIGAAFQEVSHDSDSQSNSKTLLRRLLLDPWVLTVAVLSVVFSAIPDLGWLTADTRSYMTDYVSTLVLLTIAIGAVLHGVGRLESQRERYFWRLLGLSLSAWLAGETLAFLFLDSGNATAGTGVDALYLLLYLGFVLALDIQPQASGGDLRIRPLRVLASAGRTLFVGGIFIYFVLLPRTLGVDEYLTWIPSFSFYLILDFYLFGRLIHATWKARTPRWRLTFALLSIAWAFVLTTDSIDFAWLASYLPDTVSRATEICWYAPMILVVVASRMRNLTTSANRQPISDEDDDRIRGVPLLVYSLGFALIHLALSSLQHGAGPLQNARVSLVMLCLVVFGALNLVQNSITEKQSRQQSLRRKEAEEHIRSLSRQDPLTGLLNRRAFDTEFARAVARASRSETVLGLMFIDLDHFKTVNDTFGHSAGDSVLCEVAARIKAFTREVDTLARYGGDEFVLVFEALEDQASAEIVGTRILDGFKMGFQFESGRIELSASIGIAIFPGHGRTPSQLFEAADRAMYKVKQSGGSGILTA